MALGVELRENGLHDCFMSRFGGANEIVIRQTERAGKVFP
jgi:hypothetical protein